MAQFRIFRSTDAGAPVLYGSTGSLIGVLDHCLYSGSGWLKPFPNSGSAVTSPSGSWACYQQPTGSSGTGSAGCTLYINDKAPSGTALYKEAWATGWENMYSLYSPVGSGSGQFPTAAQLLTTGHVVIRKSTTNDSTTPRAWIVASDSSSFYLFIGAGDIANAYYGFAFGDIYSFVTASNDAYRCIIIGRNAENTGAAANDGFDLLSALNTATVGNFMPRAYTAAAGSITTGKHGDGVKGSTTTYLGSVPFPNASDYALYISPVWVVENGTSTIRGQLRGFYQCLHPIANFSDQQVLSGSLDFGGKTFLVLKTTPNSAVYVIETSNTLLTN